MRTRTVPVRINGWIIWFLLLIGFAFLLLSLGLFAQTPAPAVNINTASVAEIANVPYLRLGTTWATTIIANRPYSSVEELRRVPGITAGFLALFRGAVTVNVPSTDPPPPPGVIVITCAVTLKNPIQAVMTTMLDCDGSGTADMDPAKPLVRRSLIVISTEANSSLEATVQKLLLAAGKADADVEVTMTFVVKS